MANSCYIGMPIEEFLQKGKNMVELSGLDSDTGITKYRANNYDVWSGDYEYSTYFYFKDGKLVKIGTE